MKWAVRYELDVTRIETRNAGWITSLSESNVKLTDANLKGLRQFMSVKSVPMCLGKERVIPPWIYFFLSFRERVGSDGLLQTVHQPTIFPRSTNDINLCAVNDIRHIQYSQFKSSNPNPVL